MEEAAPYLIFAGIVGFLVAWRVNKYLLIGMKKTIEFHTRQASISMMGARLARYQHPPEDVIGLIKRLQG